MSQLFSWVFSYDGLAFILMMTAYYFFVRDIKKPGSKNKVNVSTWVAWGILDTLLFFAYLQMGDMPWTIPAYVIGVTWVVLTAVRKGATFTPSYMDYFCFAVAVVAALWWLVYGGLLAAVLCVAGGCVVATIPLALHLWEEPASDSLAAWSFGFLGSAVAVLGVRVWSVEGALIQACFFGLSAVILTIVLRRFLPKFQVG